MHIYVMNTKIVFSTAKKEGRALNHKMGHCDCTKGASFSEKSILVLPLSNLNKQSELLKLNY